MLKKTFPPNRRKRLVFHGALWYAFKDWEENAVHESGEMYLETILILEGEKPLVRAIDVAERMNFSKPSVSRALGKLKADGYILVDETGRLTFTEKGRAVAEKIYERHNVLAALLVSLGVSEKTAIGDACKIEHDISDESFDAIKASIRRHATYPVPLNIDTVK